MRYLACEDVVVSIAKPHSIKKFELISHYADVWARILLNYKKCRGIVYIDCMSNSGEYRDEYGNVVYGTPVLVVNSLADLAKKYLNKKVWVMFNDINVRKIDHLEKLLPPATENFIVKTKVSDGNVLLKDIAKKIKPTASLAYLVVYDPYKASIDWDAVEPFFNEWSEVVINHMVSDPVRSKAVLVKDEVKKKLEQTYQQDIEGLLHECVRREDFERRVLEIIRRRSIKGKKIYIASYPFFNRNNQVVFNLLHCSGSKTGFNKFKDSVWTTFHGKSSGRRIAKSNMLMDSLFQEENEKNCYDIIDVVEYLQKKFNGSGEISLKEITTILENHPIFPSGVFRKDIYRMLNSVYGAVIQKNSIIFCQCVIK